MTDEVMYLGSCGSLPSVSCCFVLFFHGNSTRTFKGTIYFFFQPSDHLHLWSSKARLHRLTLSSWRSKRKTISCKCGSCSYISRFVFLISNYFFSFFCLQRVLKLIKFNGIVLNTNLVKGDKAREGLKDLSSKCLFVSQTFKHLKFQ